MKNTTRTRGNFSRRKGRKPNLKLAIEKLSESKYLTDSCHHFPLSALASIAYSDTGIFIGGWTATNKVPQGIQNNQRIGNRMTVKHLDYKFNLFAPTNSPDTVRIIVIKDTAPKGIVPLLTDMFDNPNNNLSPISPNSMGQYQIIRDHYVDIGGYLPVRSIRIQIPYKIETKYYGNGPNLGDIENNALYIIVLSVNGFSSTEVLQFYSVIRYKDI
jgi:hypothetical protein